MQPVGILHGQPRRLRHYDEAWMIHLHLSPVCELMGSRQARKNSVSTRRADKAVESVVRKNPRKIRAEERMRVLHVIEEKCSSAPVSQVWAHGSEQEKRGQWKQKRRDQSEVSKLGWSDVVLPISVHCEWLGRLLQCPRKQQLGNQGNCGESLQLLVRNGNIWCVSQILWRQKLRHANKCSDCLILALVRIDSMETIRIGGGAH